MKKEIVDLILDFLKEAGEIALNYQNNLSANIKKDKSIVTEVDLKISELFSKRIKKFTDTGKHKLLDEENLPNRKDFFNDKTEYLWTIDPIDGTTTYFYGFNLWAIGIGLYKNYEPYMGFIYMPYSSELVYTDGDKSYYSKNIFSNDKEELKVKDLKILEKGIIIQHKLKNYNKGKFLFLDLYSSYVIAFYTLIGKSIASFINNPMKLWDISATLPIAKNIGMDFKNIETNKNIEKLSDIKTDEEWRLCETYMICNNKLYEDIKRELFE